MSSQPIRPSNLSRQSQPPNIDNELLRGIAEHNQGSMMALYDKYAFLACSIAAHVLADTAAAEEVVQDVFLNIWNNPLAFDPARGSFRVWIAVVVRHKALDALRKRRPSSPLDEASPATSQLSQESALISGQLYGRALEAIRQLPELQRHLFEMSYLQGLTHVEITQLTGLPLGTVKTRLRAALDGLRKALNPEPGLRVVKTNEGYFRESLEK